MQAMICTPSQISTQLSTDSYRRRHVYGSYTREQWDARVVKCRQCKTKMNASSLSCHLVDIHKIYQQTVVGEEFLEDQVGMPYRATTLPNGKLACPFPGCVEELGSGWMMRRHFRDIHPKDHAKGAMVPMLQELQHASEPCLPKVCSYQRIHKGHGKTTTARSGSGIGTCSLLSLHGPWGRP
jgi:hypothetical protein